MYPCLGFGNKSQLHVIINTTQNVLLFLLLAWPLSSLIYIYIYTLSCTHVCFELPWVAMRCILKSNRSQEMNTSDILTGENGGDWVAEKGSSCWLFFQCRTDSCQHMCYYILR